MPEPSSRSQRRGTGFFPAKGIGRHIRPLDAFFRISFVVAVEVSPFPRRQWVLVTGAISFQSF